MDDRNFQLLQDEIAALRAEMARLNRRQKRCPRFAGCAGKKRTLVCALLLLPAAAYAATISIPHVFVNGTVADADHVNENFSTLATESNDQDSRLAALEAGLAGLQAQVTTNATAIGANAADIAVNQGEISAHTASIAVITSDVAANQASISTNSAAIGSNTAGIAALDTTFSGTTRVGDLLTFSGVNVQIVDGSGDTSGPTNGLGNLIIGYDENTTGVAHTGSHNLVLGSEHEYTSFAELLGWGL
jgi:hypothetical protein